jgi:GT2 family glycosyltransferase
LSASEPHGVSPAPVTAIVTAYRRIDQAIATLRKINECNPPPAEVIVHVDGNQTDCATAIAAAFPDARVIVSSHNVGPGGGRNKLVAAASHDIVASFDDDSYPLDSDYFGRVIELFRHRPGAAAIAGRIVGEGRDAATPNAADRPSASPTVNFVGCGVVYRRGDFLASGGYVPLPVAYGMEEVDLCIRLLDAKQSIYYSPWLRIFHDNDLSHHTSAAITTGSIANIALLVYLRYPIRYWPYGVVQVGHRVAWLLKVGRWRGILGGILGIPSHLWRHRALRATVHSGVLSTYLRARTETPVLAPLDRR